MSKRWLILIFLCSIFLMATLKTHELSSLRPFFKAERTIRLDSFQQARRGLSDQDQSLLELWESILTGRSAPVSKWMKDQYRTLALNHLFTPSGFHLSAVLMPLQWFIKTKSIKLTIFLLLGLGLLWLPGMAALKRMLWVKTFQLVMNQKTGFVLAMLLDVILGRFSLAPLSFSYSFLFLGIIYSGLRGASLIYWFFLAQLLLAYFQGNTISPLLIVFSPILNLCFGIAMPILFLLAFPLWHWQLHTGLMLLKYLQQLVELASKAVALFPVWEVNIGFVVFCIFILYGRFKVGILTLSILSLSLNIDLQKEPSLGSHEFHPQGNIVKSVSKPEEDLIYFEDGKCKRKLVRGMWWENCSPVRRSSTKTIKKLSYPSSGLRKFSLRGSRTSGSS